MQLGHNQINTKTVGRPLASTRGFHGQSVIVNESHHEETPICISAPILAIRRQYLMPPPLSLSLSLSLSLLPPLSVAPSPSVCMSFCVSVCVSVCLSVCLSVSLSLPLKSKYAYNILTIRTEAAVGNKCNTYI